MVTPAPPPDSNRLVWLDLEMTGLDTRRHVIVEIAVIVTDSDLEPLDEGIDIVIGASDAELAEMDEFVTTMHTRSGLLTEIRASGVTRPEAMARALDYVRHHVPTPRTAPLCGNTIGADRRFLDVQMHALEEYLHYRSIDVSSLKELARRWNPSVFRARPGKTETHRALDDIRESIAELRHYREHFLRLPGPPGTPVDAG
ncbi:MAG: oligoribonuclease [Actinomycetes bacterium]